MELNIFERIQALQIISKLQGNLISVRVYSSMKKKLQLSDAELKEFEITLKDGNFVPGPDGRVWNAKGDEKRPLDLALIERSVLRDELKKLDEKSALTQDMLSLYEAAFAEKETPAK